MKPLSMRCKKYCDLYPCKRDECNRKPILYDNAPIKMEEPKIWANLRKSELATAYKAVPLSKADLLTKY